MLAPLMVTALPFWLTVMLLPPASVIVPLEICAITPAVLPLRVTLCRFWVWTDSVAEMRKPELVAAIEMIPSPRRERVRASYVPDDDDVVLPTAKTEPAWLDWVALIRKPLLVAAMEIIPSPRSERVRAS